MLSYILKERRQSLLGVISSVVETSIRNSPVKFYLILQLEPEQQQWRYLICLPQSCQICYGLFIFHPRNWQHKRKEIIAEEGAHEEDIVENIPERAARLWIQDKYVDLSSMSLEWYRETAELDFELCCEFLLESGTIIHFRNNFWAPSKLSKVIVLQPSLFSDVLAMIVRHSLIFELVSG
ncbi:hypothetical protein Pelo_19719 [Pelomyxa schiedti]|nr:hypothetical protein Pelo_19719 [Pelomyxa schiedti]